MKNPRRLPDGELEIMNIIWQLESPVSRPEIEDSLSESKPLAGTTILTVLTRLCEKGFLSIEKHGKTNFYTPLISQREYLACESRNIFQKLYGGSVKTLAVSLCDSGISRQELEQLRQLLERDEL